MSNSRDIAALIAALLEAHGSNTVEVFSWGSEVPSLTWPPPKHPPVVGSIFIRQGEAGINSRGNRITVETSDHKRFIIQVFDDAS